MRALLERWRSDMVNATKARHITPDKHGNWTVTDQLALTLIFTVRPFPCAKPSLSQGTCCCASTSVGVVSNQHQSPSSAATPCTQLFPLHLADVPPPRKMSARAHACKSRNV